MVPRPLVALALIVLASPAFAQTDVDPRSLMTTPVWLLRGTQPISQGTGFFYASTTASDEIDTVFLVTNYHVVTGYSPQSDGRKGDHIRLILHRNQNDLRDIQAVDLPLYDDRGQPLWITSDRTPNADVVLVPLPRRVYERVRLLVFTEAHTRGDIRIRPTTGATLLGYPFGFYDTVHYLPVWKTGHIASEPDVDFEGRPVFLVDVSAFPGMSGSPVLAVANGIYEAQDGSMRTGRVLKLLGIFSAMPVVRETRPSTDPLDSQAARTVDTSLQLGYVWKASVIAELARQYRPVRLP